MTEKKEIRITEQNSSYKQLEKMSTSMLLKNINKEDKTVAIAYTS